MLEGSLCGTWLTVWLEITLRAQRYRDLFGRLVKAAVG
jgi:hypothetical protein